MGSLLESKIRRIVKQMLTESTLSVEDVKPNKSYLIGYRRVKFNAKFIKWGQNKDKLPIMIWEDEKSSDTFECYLFNGVMSIGSSADKLIIYKEI